MAAAFDSTGAPGATSPLAPAHDLERLHCWTAHPTAQILLASCAANPPAGEWKRQAFGRVVDRWWIYTGRRVEQLEAIRAEIGSAALAEYDRLGEDGAAAFCAWCDMPGVTEAIDLARQSVTPAGRA